MAGGSLSELGPSGPSVEPGTTRRKTPAAVSGAALASPREPEALVGALEQLVRLMEYQLPAMRGSVLLLDDDGATLHHGAAPSLPPEYCRAIDGARIGPATGSCGTAAYRGAQVIVTDIATDPLWADYSQLALPHGLRACWSTPIRAGERVLGTFAMYYEEPRAPTKEELGMTAIASLLASNIIMRARAEAALRTSEAELRKRTEAAERWALALAEGEAEMRAARAEAEHANKTKSDFLATMSHELRTPLNAIGGYATLMLDGIPIPASEGQQKFLRRVLEAQKHLLALIENVLVHAKLEAGRMTYAMTSVRVGELLDDVEALSAPLLANKRITCDCTHCDRTLVVRADRQKAVQILLNLVSNAVKFTTPGGCITLRTFVPAPGRAVIGVRDTGVGMSAAQVAMVFEPFVQFEHRLTGESKGTGLGLPISRQLARGMGGELQLESEAGDGTEFFLTLAMDESETLA